MLYSDYARMCKFTCIFTETEPTSETRICEIVQQYKLLFNKRSKTLCLLVYENYIVFVSNGKIKTR